MPTIELVPGTLNISVSRGNSLSIDLDFSLDLTDYVLTSRMADKDITVTMTDTTAGHVNLYLSSTDVSFGSLPQPWYLKWTDPGNAIRTVLAGKVKTI